VTVFDDYSHNPAKIAAACSALLPHFAALHVIWRPHGYGPLRVMGDALAQTFGTLLRPDDHLQVLPVYDVGGTADRSVTHLDFVGACERLGVPTTASDDYDAVCAQLSAHTRPGHAVLVMGARDPYLPDLAKRLVAACSARSAS
jgi:UDP-N-acetylmuramate--alanine ligase